MKKIESNVENIKVTKANQLNEIRLLEVGSRLKLRDQKVILSIVGQISPEDEDFKDYQITLPELVSMTGIDKKDLYKEIDAICTRLMSSVITIKELENKDGFLKVTWFSHAEYSPSQGTIGFSVSPRLKPYLLQLKGNFTTYNLKQVINLKSTYSIRLYELLRQFLPLAAIKAGKTQGFREMELSDIREHLGVEKNKYPQFAEFKRNIIERTQRELTEHTDLKFEFEPIRRGRKIASIKFSITHNPKFEPVKDDVLEGDLAGPANISTISPHVIQGIKGQLPDITDEQLSLIGNTYPQELILEGLFDLMRAMASGGVNGSPLNYYLGILKNKRREEQAAEPKANKTTDEKLSDRSWADGLDIG